MSETTYTIPNMLSNGEVCSEFWRGVCRAVRFLDEDCLAPVELCSEAPGGPNLCEFEANPRRDARAWDRRFIHTTCLGLVAVAFERHPI